MLRRRPLHPRPLRGFTLVEVMVVVGRVRWLKWGSERAVLDDTALTAQAAESRGKPVLVTNNLGMIETRDPITIVYFGDTYRRKLP